MSKKSAILDLQDMARSSTTNITDLLRNAKVVASKLNLDEFEAWIDCEKDGYADISTVPSYRKVPSKLMAQNPVRGPMPVVWESIDALSTHFAEMPFLQPISTIQHLVTNAKSSMMQGSVTPPELSLLIQLSPEIQRYPLFRQMSTASVAAILDAVRDKVLAWTLALEKKGVLVLQLDIWSGQRTTLHPGPACCCVTSLPPRSWAAVAILHS